MILEVVIDHVMGAWHDDVQKTFGDGGRTKNGELLIDRGPGAWLNELSMTEVREV